MSMNWKEIDGVLKEWNLEGAFLQDVRQSSYYHIFLEFRKPGESLILLVALNQGFTRIHRVSRRPPCLRKPPRFTEFLRSQVQGYRVSQVSQVGQERIVHLAFQGPDGSRHLWIRLWGGASNILCTDQEGTILDAAFRRPKKGERSGGHYWPLDDFPAEAAPQTKAKNF